MEERVQGIGELLRMDIYENGTQRPYYFHHNLIGSITGISDKQGNLIELVEYDPYGKVYFLRPTGNPENPYELSETSTIGNNYLFQGREYDPETGLYYFRARYYHPELGRFLQTDPNGYEDSLNHYQSFLNNPLNFADPMGEKVYNRQELEDMYWKYIKNSKQKMTFKEWIDLFTGFQRAEVYKHKGKILYTYDPRVIDEGGDVIIHDREHYIHHDPTYTLIPITKHRNPKLYSPQALQKEYESIHSFPHHFDPRRHLENPLVDPEVARAARRTVFRYHIEDREHALRIFETYRTFERSDELKRSGRIAAEAGKSWHNYGLAVDIVFQDVNGNPSWAEGFNWTKLGKIGFISGFTHWGGNWRGRYHDRPHFQIAISNAVPDEIIQIYNLFGGGELGISAVQIYNRLRRTNPNISQRRR